MIGNAPPGGPPRRRGVIPAAGPDGAPPLPPGPVRPEPPATPKTRPSGPARAGDGHPYLLGHRPALSAILVGPGGRPARGGYRTCPRWWHTAHKAGNSQSRSATPPRPPGDGPAIRS